MRRNAGVLIITFALGIFCAPQGADAQQPGRFPRIGFLFPGTVSAGSLRVAAFLQGLRELGYVEGQNIAIEFRYADGKLDRLPDLAAELVRLKVDIIVAPTDPAIQAAQASTRTIPIVMAVSTDPVATGLVASLARPGGNTTGLSMLAPELSGKRLQLLKEVLPKTSRVAVLWNSKFPDMALRFKETQVAAPILGVTLWSLEVRDPDELERTFAAMLRERPDALFIMVDPFTVVHRKRIADFAAQSRLPSIYESRDFVDVGGLICYGPNIPGMFHRAATFVDKILKGAKPADLPVEQPTRFELVINLKTAKALGLTVPQSIFIQADQVIQ